MEDPFYVDEGQDGHTCKLSFAESIITKDYQIGSGLLKIDLPEIVQNPSECMLLDLPEVKMMDLDETMAPAISLDLPLNALLV